MKTFTKWFLLNAIIFTALFFAQTRGALTIIVENDISKLSVLIMSLYVLLSGYVGHLCYLSDHMSDKNSKTRKKKKTIYKEEQILAGSPPSISFLLVC